MLKLFLILLTATTFGQSWFWGWENNNTTTPPTETVEDILSNLVALWQNGDTVDVTGRGNDLTRSHTNPKPLPDAWDDEITYNTGDLCTHLGYVFRSKQDGNTYQPEAPGAEDEWWTVHAPYKTATGLAGIDSAITFNGIDHYLSRASTSDLQLGGTDFTIAVWVKANTYPNFDLIAKGGAEEYLIASPDDPGHYSFNNTTSSVMPDDSWTLICIVGEFEGETSSFSYYFNGTFDETNAAELNIVNGASDFFVANTVYWNYLNGSIAQLAIYKRALTAEQITDLYSGGDGKLIVP